MKTESNIAPVAPYDISIVGDDAEITFYDSIVHVEASGETPEKYTYDEYRLRVRYRDNLIPSIDANIAAWLEAAKAKEYETLAAEVRARRDELLAATDKTQYADYPISAELRASYAAYRQALRDVPDQMGFPYDVAWPVEPSK